MNDKLIKKRIWEIDLLRGVALLLMIIFHVVFDLKDIYNYPIHYDRGVFYYVGKISAILFMLVAGISSSFSRSNVKRGLKVFALAMIVTLATYIFDPSLIILFGILHFFGVSMMLYPLIEPINKYVLIVLGTLVIVIGNMIANITVPYNFLFPVGLTTSSFFSSDYYPLLPWFGIYLYGVALGKIFYKQKKSLLNFQIRDNFFMLLGRHTLIVYAIHQPIIILVLNLIMK